MEISFEPFHPGLDPSTTLIVDGYSPGFRMISHWPGHNTPKALRHDLTTGSALIVAEMSSSETEKLVGRFSVVTNDHYDTDGVLSLFSMLQPQTALHHRDLILRTARTGDFAVWTGADALALELSIMADLSSYFPFTTPPFDEQRLENLSGLYVRTIGRMESLLKDPYAMRDDWSERYDQVVSDVARVEAGEGIHVTRFEEDDLAVVQSDRPITTLGLRLAAGNLFRVLLVHPSPKGNRYRFCFRGESWWDVISVRPMPRIRLAGLAETLNQLETNGEHSWWAAPPDWIVPELGFGDATKFELQSVRFDPQIQNDPPSSLSTEVVVRELRRAFRETKPYLPVAVLENGDDQ